MPEFTNTLRQFAQDLKRDFHSRIAAQPEDQLKPGVQQLLRATARQVETRTEDRAELDARSDVGVALRGLLSGCRAATPYPLA
jgi:hypothetical protein